MLLKQLIEQVESKLSVLIANLQAIEKKHGDIAIGIKWNDPAVGWSLSASDKPIIKNNTVYILSTYPDAGKLSVLIANLQAIEKEHGDIAIGIRDVDYIKHDSYKTDLWLSASDKPIIRTVYGLKVFITSKA